jgi:hypothetical protein
MIYNVPLFCSPDREAQANRGGNQQQRQGAAVEILGESSTLENLTLGTGLLELTSGRWPLLVSWYFMSMREPLIDDL